MSQALGVVQRGLGRAMRSIWPRRKHTELLLDLGERKAWTEVDELAALRGLSRWLVEELGLQPQARGAPREAGDVALLRDFGERLVGADSPPGTAAWISGLASAVGASPKTFANSLGHGLQSARADHRWACLIIRILQDDGASNAWAYHRRCPASVGAELARFEHAHLFDAGDALLCSSLVALWQRRRPTANVRANRGLTRERRRTPMPIAGLGGRLVELGQLQPLARVCQHLSPERGRILALFVVEAALTEAHLEPHPARSHAKTSTGESWLRGVEELTDTTGVLSSDDARILAFRVERLRAWRERRPQPTVDAALRHDPHVQALLHLEELVREGPQSNPERRFSPHTPGLLMLLPQLRARGCVEP